MNPTRVARHRLMNVAQTALLLVAMAGLLGTLAWMLGGRLLLGIAILMVMASWVLIPRISPVVILRAYRARPLTPQEVPALYEVLGLLATRARLRSVPLLAYVPSHVMNAFAVGSGRRAAIALSDGLLRRMTVAELAGILAHEVTHIQYGDTRLMGFADLIGRATGALATMGLLLAVINLPLALLGLTTMNWWAILLLIVSPTVTALIQLALSRTREYDADLGAARLLGDTRPMIAALRKLDLYHTSLLRRLLSPLQRLPEPCLLRTHPATKERIRRLLALHENLPAPLATDHDGPPTDRVAPSPIRPRRHRTGSWF